MSKTKKTAKKEFRTKIAEQLNTTFGDLKGRISAKKFERKIRKASKVLSQGVKPAKSEKPTKKKTVKKSPQQAEEPKLSTV
jgi:hypothetical protein